ncbi:MAG: cytochrome c3 family protein [Alphaproteobacteria bacterium]
MAVLLIATLAPRSGFYTNTAQAREQPVPFSHAHHVGGLGIDCRYCHNSVEVSAFAGLPATGVCMTCHSQIWTNAAMLAPVRDSLATGQPLEWKRVNSVPDFVYFNHAIHLKTGVACVTCHGQVDDMPLMVREHPLTMDWCLDCHRDPAPRLRPPSSVFDMRWKPPRNLEAIQAALMTTNDIRREKMMDCYACHR